MLNNGVEVILKPDTTNERGNNFHVVRETLERIGVPNSEQGTLTQSCHILSKQGRYYIMHHREFDELEGNVAYYTDDDLEMRDAIAIALDKWELIELIDKPEQTRSMKSLGLNVLKNHEKRDWELIQKYNMSNFFSKKDNA